MLGRFGWAASLTRDGLERTDILAVHVESRRMIEVQVKTIRAGNSWPLGRKGSLPAVSDREWYVLVRLGDPPAAPESFVVPRDHVAAATWVGHLSWLTEPGVPAGKRNAGIEGARIKDDVWESYRERWSDLDEFPSTSVAVRLPPWMREAMRKPGVMLPEEHPWWDAASIPDWPGQ